jgi:RNA polymerase sigma factor (sigma-70 family)
LSVASDAKLIAASLEDPDAFAAVFDRHYPLVAGFFRRRLDRSIADELAAETFLRAFDARGRYDLTRPDARPWLFGIAANLLSGQRRSEERGLRALARAGERVTRGELDEVDERVDASMASPVLAAALASLAAGDREVLLLYAWADLSYEQISSALQIPVGTVRSRLHRARATVRKKLERSEASAARAAARTGEESCEQRA